MRSLYNCHWHTMINLDTAKNLMGRTTFLSTDIECSFQMKLDPKTFIIKNAFWEIYRGPEKPISLEIKELTGIEAYLGCGKALRQAILPTYGDMVLTLALDTVRGIIQSESFLIQERGFSHPQEYVNYWEKAYANSCRHFSNLNQTDSLKTWVDQLSNHKRYDTLYNRFKSVLITGDTQNIRADASLSDSFHEVGLTMGADRVSTAISSVDCRLLRAPYDICFEAQSFSENLLGYNLKELSKKKTAEILMGNQGCVHIIDLCYDAANILNSRL